MTSPTYMTLYEILEYLTNHLNHRTEEEHRHVLDSIEANRKLHVLGNMAVAVGDVAREPTDGRTDTDRQRGWRG